MRVSYVIDARMTIRLLQLNLQKGARLDAVIRYIRRGNFDVACLQEVAGGRLAHRGRNCYEALVAQTGMMGQLGVYINVKGDISSYVGNATLFHTTWNCAANHVIWLKRYQELADPSCVDPRVVARCAVATILKHDDTELLIVNTHLVWGPTPYDALYKRSQADILYRWIKNHTKPPFILAGDFNLNPQTTIVTKLSHLGVNLTKRYRITNTLNPRTHYAKNLFPSGLPVDYVITDKRITVKKFFVEDRVDLSDHFGLVVEVSL